MLSCKSNSRKDFVQDNQIDAVPKFEVFHHRLSAFTVSLSLEASEVPEISNMFWRAKDAVYQDRMGNVFRGVLI